MCSVQKNWLKPVSYQGKSMQPSLFISQLFNFWCFF